MTDTPEPGKIPATVELRRAPRAPGPFAATMRASTERPVQIPVADLSITGFRAAWPNKLRINDMIWLRLPDLAPLEARVVWSDHASIGCEFASPLHPAVLSAIVSKHGSAR